MAEVAVPEVGSVLYSSWGYDQTNVDFYQVVRTSASSVWVVPMRKHCEAAGFMSGHVVPTEPILSRVVHKRNSEGGIYYGESEEVEVKPAMYRWNKNGYARISYSEYAQVWDGKPKYQSWYA
jgi:hypothetical protein